MHAFLLVEDEDAIAVAFRAAVGEAYIPVLVHRVSNGEQALEYLRHAAVSRGGQCPDLVFLDLNMPKLGGWEVLKEMRADERLRPIPVVIFSTSCRRSDKERAYALGAQHFLPKPIT